MAAVMRFASMLSMAGATAVLAREVGAVEQTSRTGARETAIIGDREKRQRFSETHTEVE